MAGNDEVRELRAEAVVLARQGELRRARELLEAAGDALLVAGCFREAASTYELLTRLLDAHLADPARPRLPR